VGPAKTAEPIDIPFGLWTRIGSRNHVLDGGPDPMHEGAILRAKRGQPRTCPDMSVGRYTQSNSAEGRTVAVRVLIGVY